MRGSTYVFFRNALLVDFNFRFPLNGEHEFPIHVVILGVILNVGDAAGFITANLYST